MSNVYAYHLFKAAQQKFGRKPRDLRGSESDAASAVARKTLFVEDRILASQVSETVSVALAEVHDARRAIIASYDSYCDFLDDLHQSGLDDRVLFLALHRQLSVEKTIAKVTADIEQPSEAQISDFYRRRKHEFVRPELRAVSHILITINPQFPENSPAEARKRIKELYARLQAKPESFALLAELHSECPSALQSGNLGVVGRGQMMKPLEEAVFALRQGGISAPVETEAGFHIARCDQITPSRLVSLQEARAKISTVLSEAKRQQAKRQWIKTICAPAAATPVHSKGKQISAAAQKRRQVWAT